MGITSIVDSEKGQILISIVLGLGLASLFRKVCTDGNCIVIEGPPLEEVENKIFKQESKCYRYKAVSTQCKKGSNN
jgi:hypothetical protein